jgi:hypothetical protein
VDWRRISRCSEEETPIKNTTEVADREIKYNRFPGTPPTFKYWQEFCSNNLGGRK